MAKILYRLPEQKTAHELICSQTTTIGRLCHYGQQRGYAFAPFDVGGKHPMLLFVPNEENSWIVPNRFTTRHIEYTTDDNYRRSLYRQEFQACHQCLHEGRVAKIVLSRGLRLTTDAPLSDEDLRNLFINTCHHYPHSFVALIAYDQRAWLIATPEVLLEQSEGTLRTMALAATMSIEEGAALPPSQWTDKNRHEQFIVAKYIGQRLSNLGIEFSTSAVHTKVAGQLVHLCTDFSMDLSDDIGPIVAALHPTPAVCGLPATDAAHLIHDIEHHDREYYAGFSGPIGLEGGTHLYVTLRCMQLCGTTAHLYAGGGLLRESECESEWIETQRKLRTMLHVLQ